MGQVSDILEGKGREVLRIDPSATVYDADRLAGIVTERDYLRRVTLQDRDERTTPVGEIMTPELVFVGPDASVEECIAVMTDRRIRHLPVVTAEREVVGMFSIG